VFSSDLCRPACGEVLTQLELRLGPDLQVHSACSVEFLAEFV
jgi:hypothetical protein